MSAAASGRAAAAVAAPVLLAVPQAWKGKLTGFVAGNRAAVLLRAESPPTPNAAEDG